MNQTQKLLNQLFTFPPSLSTEAEEKARVRQPVETSSNVKAGPLVGFWSHKQTFSHNVKDRDVVCDASGRGFDPFLRFRVASKNLPSSFIFSICYDHLALSLKKCFKGRRSMALLRCMDGVYFSLAVNPNCKTQPKIFRTIWRLLDHHNSISWH